MVHCRLYKRSQLKLDVIWPLISEVPSVDKYDFYALCAIVVNIIINALTESRWPPWWIHPNCMSYSLSNSRQSVMHTAVPVPDLICTPRVRMNAAYNSTVIRHVWNKFAYSSCQPASPCSLGSCHLVGWPYFQPTIFKLIDLIRSRCLAECDRRSASRCVWSWSRGFKSRPGHKSANQAVHPHLRINW